MSTFAELQQAAATLPLRIQMAVYLGDAEKLAELQKEQTALPAQLLFAELLELQEQLADEQTDMEEAKADAAAAGAKVAQLRDAVRAAQAELLTAEREAGQVQNRIYYSTDRLRSIRRRIEEIAADQTYQAQVAAAPVVRSMLRSR